MATHKAIILKMFFFLTHRGLKRLTYRFIKISGVNFIHDYSIAFWSYCVFTSAQTQTGPQTHSCLTDLVPKFDTGIQFWHQGHIPNIISLAHWDLGCVQTHTQFQKCFFSDSERSRSGDSSKSLSELVPCSHTQAHTRSDTDRPPVYDGFNAYRSMILVYGPYSKFHP